MTDAAEPERHERAVAPPDEVGHLDQLDADYAVVPVTLFDNINLLVPRAQALETDADSYAGLRGAPPLQAFDEPERDRMYGLAVQFVNRHTRTVRSAAAVSAVDHTFGDDTIVVSEKPMPRFPLRVAKLTWAVEHGRVVDVKDHRTMAYRLRRTRIPARVRIWSPGRGDEHDLAYLLANLCAIVNIQVRVPIAVTGVVALETNQIPGGSSLDEERQAAEAGGMAHLILPFAAHFMPGMHDGVRYWPARDVDEAVYSLLAAVSSDVAIPDLKRRWRIKMAWSWISLVAVLASIGGARLGGFFVGNASLVRWTLGVSVVLLALGLFATHRYRRIDR